MAKKNLNHILDLNDTNIAYTTFHDLFINEFNVCFPLKEIKKTYSTKKTWLSEGIKIAIKHKNSLFIKYKMSKHSKDLTAYKKYKSKLAKIIRDAERLHLSNLIDDNRSNLRKTWDILKGVINRKKVTKCIQAKFKMGTETTTNKQQISNSFVKFFTNVGPDLDKKIPITSTDPVSYIPGTYENNMFLNPCTA